MIKCEVTENFSLKEFDKLKIIERKGKDTKGQLNKGDIFECDEEMAKYLTGENPLNKVVIKVIEVKTKIEKEEKQEAKDEKIASKEEVRSTDTPTIEEKPKKKKTGKK